MALTVTKKEIKEVMENLQNGVSYQNEIADYQFFIAKGSNEMYKFSNGEYKRFFDLEKFARAIVRATKRGY